jgi:hypothetical protein
MIMRTSGLVADSSNGKVKSKGITVAELEER